MTLQEVNAKKVKSVTENLIILAMVGLLMAIFIYYFFKQEEHLSRTGFDSIANTFSARITGIRAQWFMDNKPRWVIIKENTVSKRERENKSIEVNSIGWVDVSLTNGVSNQNDCQIIWQQVLETPLFYIKQPISAVMVNINISDTIKDDTRMCRYGLPSGEYFEYQPSNGKVSKIQVRQ